MHGVALLMTPEAIRALFSWEPVSPRIITARFNCRGRKVTILQCYAPTNTSSLESREESYEQIQATMDKIPKRDLTILMGDLNAKVGSDNTDKELIMGRHGVGEQNENGKLFSEFCMFNDLVIGVHCFLINLSTKRHGNLQMAKRKTRLITSPWTENGDAAYMMLG